VKTEADVEETVHAETHQEQMAHAAEPAHEGGYRIYAVTWFWLLAITVLELAVVILGVPKVLLAITLITMAILKAALIMAYFMHLRYEKLSLIYTVVVPMFFLAIVLFSAVGPDALSVFYRR
jgi:cytochrome c oxidase subunit 4